MCEDASYLVTRETEGDRVGYTSSDVYTDCTGSTAILAIDEGPPYAVVRGGADCCIPNG